MNLPSLNSTDDEDNSVIGNSECKEEGIQYVNLEHMTHRRSKRLEQISKVNYTTFFTNCVPSWFKNPFAFLTLLDNDTCTLSKAKKEANWPYFVSAMEVEVSNHV